MADITEDVVADFRRVLKAFTDGDLWPTEIITQQLIEADCWTAGLMWGKFKLDDDHNFKKRGMYFLAAHFLVSYYGAEGAKDQTAIKPDARLNVAGKSVGDESTEYRITAMESTADDFLSTTIYGVMFVTLRRRASALPMAV